MIYFLYSKIGDSKYPWVIFHLMGCVLLLRTAIKDHHRGNHFLERRHVIGAIKQLLWAVFATRKGYYTYLGAT